MKHIVLIISFLLLAGCVFQEQKINDFRNESNSTPNGFTEPVIDTSKEIVLTGIKKNSSVELVWTEFTGSFKSYKVIRSITNAKPEYPGHTVLATIYYVNETMFTDVKPEHGINYYAVTVLGPYNEKIHSNAFTAQFPNPKETPDQNISLTATKTENGVLLVWTEYQGEFLFYKVVRTTDHPYPKYPDDSAIATIAYKNETWYMDTQTEYGINYYGVTIVRPDKSRFTSNRASVMIK